jgi:uncharacterized Zn-finger protein
MSGSGYSMFRNDRGVPEICIGVKEFKCIGVSPPHDHPHIYINMREADTILCPYCATRFRFDPRLTSLDADPPDSFFAVDANPGQGQLTRVASRSGVRGWRSARAADVARLVQTNQETTTNFKPLH